MILWFLLLVIIAARLLYRKCFGLREINNKFLEKYNDLIIDTDAGGASVHEPPSVPKNYDSIRNRQSARTGESGHSHGQDVSQNERTAEHQQSNST